MTDLDRDIVILSMTTWQEARGEGQMGIRAVAHTIINRHVVGKWYSRKTLAGTCLLAYAFSGWMTTDPNHEASAEVPSSDPIMVMCISEVANAIGGLTTDQTGGATHYYADGTTVPDWANPATGSIFTTQIGRHRFYRGVA